MPRLLNDEEIQRRLGELPDWTRDGAQLRASFDAPDFPGAIRLVDEVALVAEEMGHHPDIDIRWRTTHWSLSTHSEGGVTRFDIELAHRISETARTLGATAHG